MTKIYVDEGMMIVVKIMYSKNDRKKAHAYKNIFLHFHVVEHDDIYVIIIIILLFICSIHSFTTCYFLIASYYVYMLA